MGNLIKRKSVKYCVVPAVLLGIGVGIFLNNRNRDYVEIHNLTPSLEQNSMTIIYSARDKDGIKEGRVYLNGDLKCSFGREQKTEHNYEIIIIGKYPEREDVVPCSLKKGRNTVELMIIDKKGEKNSDLEEIIIE